MRKQCVPGTSPFFARAGDEANTLGTHFMAEIYVRRTSMPCIRRTMGDVKACHVDTWQSIRNLMPCITRGIYCEFTSRST